MAITLDGKIGRNAHHFPDWTGKADKQIFVEITKKSGCLIMGSKTFCTIGKPLPERKNIIMTRSPHPSKFENLEFTNKSPLQILQQLSAQGYTEVVLAGGAQINGLFAQENLIDEIILTISPLIFGEGISLFSQSLDLELTLLNFEKIDNSCIKVHYKVKKNNTHRI